MTDKVKCPASYFHSIEAKSGQPITYRQAMIRSDLPQGTWDSSASSKTNTAGATATPMRWSQRHWGVSQAVVASDETDKAMQEMTASYQ